DRPALAAGQLVAGHSGKEAEYLAGGRLVVEIFDLRPDPGRIGVFRVFQRTREVDEFHVSSEQVIRRRPTACPQNALNVNVVSERTMPGTSATLSLMNLPMSVPS